MIQVLVVDDNPDILEALDLLLSLHGYNVRKAANKKAELILRYCGKKSPACFSCL